MDCGKEGQLQPLPRSEKGVARSESTLLIFAEASRPRPDLAPGRGASQPHRLPWLHRAVPSATLDERHGRPQLLELIGRTCPTVKDILNCFFNTQGEPTARACSGLSPPPSRSRHTHSGHRACPQTRACPWKQVKQMPTAGLCRQTAACPHLRHVPRFMAAPAFHACNPNLRTSGSAARRWRRPLTSLSPTPR